MKLITPVLAAFIFAGASLSHAAEAPTDPQIAHIAYTAGTVDIGYAEIALQRSKNKAVRDFAMSMVEDHKAVNDKALALVKKLGVTPEDRVGTRAAPNRTLRPNGA
jgi:putative membrane protein